MGEPITLIDPAGSPVTTYGAAQAAALLEQGYSLPANQSDDETSDSVADSPPAPKQTTRKRAGKSKAT